jgi:hypothetical protein
MASSLFSLHAENNDNMDYDDDGDHDDNIAKYARKSISFMLVMIIML